MARGIRAAFPTALRGSVPPATRTRQAHVQTVRRRAKTSWDQWMGLADGQPQDTAFLPDSDVQPPATFPLPPLASLTAVPPLAETSMSVLFETLPP